MEEAAAPGHRKRVAILGGGVGAMVAAFELTHPDNPKRDDYEVTVYQMGWRLGGKGASGRNAGWNHRIEEHGLHIWFGFYDNAFRVMQDCYAELGRAPDAPLASWTDAFKPHPYGANIKEKVDGRWLRWVHPLPTNDATPGRGPYLLSIWSYFKEALFDLRARAKLRPAATDDVDLPRPSWPIRWIERIGSLLDTAVVELAIGVLHVSHRFARWLDIAVRPFVWLLGLFVAYRWRRARHHVRTDAGVRHAWIMTNFLYGSMRGVIESGVIENGFRSINDQEFRSWFAKYAFDDGGLTLDSAFVRTIYDGSFAFVDGDNRSHGREFPPHANMGAGVVVQNGLRTYLGYKGAAIWKMQAGMGDAVFAPLYEVLRRRGVRFRFFHRVRDIVASDDGGTIERILVGRQVHVESGLGGEREYEPLMDVKGLPSWPDHPHWDQIVDGKALEERGVDLEAWFGGWKDVEDIPLVRGRDFDEVVLGISIGAFPYLCRDLIRKSARWKAMVDHIKTVRTQSAQLWLSKTAYELGWTPMRRPILSGYDVSELDTWADMTHLVPREDWDAQAFPLHLAYLVGCMRDDEPLEVGPYGPTASPDSMDQAAADERARRTTREFLDRHILPIFPNAAVREGDGAEEHFDWSLLVDSHEEAPEGPARLDSQYFRGNVQPTERYVLSVAGSDAYRLPAHDPGEFRNLYLAGDWTDCGLNVGCVEAATTSGLLASLALSDYPPIDEVFLVEGTEPRGIARSRKRG